MGLLWAVHCGLVQGSWAIIGYQKLRNVCGRLPWGPWEWIDTSVVRAREYEFSRFAPIGRLHQRLMDLRETCSTEVNVTQVMSI